MSERQHLNAVCGVVIALSLAIACDSAKSQSAPSAKPAAPGAKTAPSCQRAAFRTVIDVGHTADVPGATSARGATEYSFNLALSQDIEKALTDAGFAKTILLITGTKPWRGLVERAMKANTMPADLFIAIHHDSVPDNLLKTWQYEGQDQQYNDDYPGYALFVSKGNREFAASLQFGHLLGEQLQARGLQYTPHYTSPIMGHRRRELLDAKSGVYRYDQLIVLKMTQMPALLLEAGSIVNRPEELELATPERRALVSAAVVAAVDMFCASRTPQPMQAKVPPKAQPSVQIKPQPKAVALPR
ncbi:MAG TPA: N-acetylmuramoyl-L-alanine amidase [Xanthobacteraceae bacterium]|nr:N-acetylmuramoyl-L-alanine amidase [Xanthobacteraceae bacterium]